MNYCADQMNLARLFEGGDRSEALGGRLAIARARVTDTTAKIERITDAMLADDAETRRPHSCAGRESWKQRLSSNKPK